MIWGVALVPLTRGRIPVLISECISSSARSWTAELTLQVSLCWGPMKNARDVMRNSRLAIALRRLAA